MYYVRIALATRGTGGPISGSQPVGTYHRPAPRPVAPGWRRRNGASTPVEDFFRWPARVAWPPWEAPCHVFVSVRVFVGNVPHPRGGGGGMKLACVDWRKGDRAPRRRRSAANRRFASASVASRPRGHAPAAAGGAEATPFAGEGEEAVVAAGVAVEPQKAVGEDPAFEVRAKLPLDEAGHRAIVFSSSREKRLELLADDRVQLGVFRAAPFVAPFSRCCEETGERGAGTESARHSRWELREAYRAVAAPLCALVRAQHQGGNGRSLRGRCGQFTLEGCGRPPLMIMGRRARGRRSAQPS
jgi:hypothetical protein